MPPAPRHFALPTTAVLAALLMACSSHAAGPLEHGTVKDKRHKAATSTPIYQDRYRETNCRTVTNALTLTGISRPSTTGGSGGRSRGGSSGGVSKVKPGSPNKLDKNNSGNSSGGSGDRSRRVCDRQYLGRVQTGVHTTPETWEVLIVKGDRSRWKPVTEAKWRKIKVGDHI
ncbi:hypothetical protein [Streptomyces marianii]|uniref:SH3 domain-containing protein n=1 Tax=Streptomyces marianii TaxID=1817406 RepID=A0A5R9DU62_9ACTN|nr:hypothetical protein [Streptomyces marianii]TLQ39294.1 hypothetical protein FEF34_38530 [Streptomyces marianii]